jgi:hypothetical protein
MMSNTYQLDDVSDPGITHLQLRCPDSGKVPAGFINPIQCRRFGGLHCSVAKGRRTLHL